MFRYIDYVDYDTVTKTNIFCLTDTCFRTDITSPYNSPSIKGYDNKVNNAITLLSIIKHYESINRNVAHNVASYFNWLYKQGFYIDRKVLASLLGGLDLIPGTNATQKYYNGILWYLQHKYLMYL